MPKKRQSNPLISPVFITGVGFDFYKEFVIVTVDYPAELEQLKGEQRQARFLVQADQMEALGAQFIEAGQLALKSLKPAGNA